jgi:PAT family beta-lactamase induction signal transducer AmpG
MTFTRRLLLGLFVLYLAQGLFFGYFTALNAGYLLSHGRTPSDVGAFGVVALLPFAIKIALGAVSDRFNFLGYGHRKPYIALGLAVQALGLVALGFINPEKQFTLFLAVAFAGQLGMALYDCCTDGLAVDVVPAELMGRVQGLMGAGRSVGVVIAALAGGWVAQHLGWGSVFPMLAGLTVATALSLAVLPKASRLQQARFSWSGFKVLAMPATWLRLSLAMVVAALGLGANQVMLPELQRGLGLDSASVGVLGAVWALGGLFGAVLGGRLFDQFGMRRAVLVSVLLLAGSLAALSVAPALLFAYLLVFFYGVGFGASQATTFATLMACTPKEPAAASFAALMMMVNVGYAVGVGVTGIWAARWGGSTVLLAYSVALLAIALMAMSLWGMARRSGTHQVA